MSGRPGSPSRRRGKAGGPGGPVRLRSIAADLLDRVLASRAPLDHFLPPVLEGLGRRDAALLRELLLGTLRWLLRLDHVIAAAARRPLDRIDAELRSPLRLGAYQLLMLERVPAYAAVSEAVEGARRRSHRGGASFVNAVLRRISERPRLDAWPVELADPVERLAVESSHPRFLVERWWRRFGAAAAGRIVAANNDRRPLQLLSFADRGGREPLAARLAEEGVETAATRRSPLGLEVRVGRPLEGGAFAAGDFYLQDQASQAAALVPPPRPGERVLDLAAAPGGKSFAMAAYEPTVRSLAADASVERLTILRGNARRLGRSMPLVAADAGRPPLAGRFDRVVLDLPCSGTGTLSRHPELKWRLSSDEIARLADGAAVLMAGAATVVRPGGLLVAITCSLEEEENEAVAERFLAERSDFSPLRLDDRLPSPLDAGLADGAGPGLWRLLPEPDHDGFTVQVLQRSGG